MLRIFVLQAFLSKTIDTPALDLPPLGDEVLKSMFLPIFIDRCLQEDLDEEELTSDSDCRSDLTFTQKLTLMESKFWEMCFKQHHLSYPAHTYILIYIKLPLYTSRSQKLRSRSNSLTKSQWLNGYSILLFSSNQLGLELNKAFTSVMARIVLPIIHMCRVLKVYLMPLFSLIFIVPVIFFVLLFHTFRCCDFSNKWNIYCWHQMQKNQHLLASVVLKLSTFLCSLQSSNWGWKLSRRGKITSSIRVHEG